MRVRPASWPVLNLPREEYINDGKAAGFRRTISDTPRDLPEILESI